MLLSGYPAKMAFKKVSDTAQTQNHNIMDKIVKEWILSLLHVMMKVSSQFFMQINKIS